MSKPSEKPDPHPGVAAGAISVMALAAAMVLEGIGLTRGSDEALASAMQGLGLEGGVTPLEPWMGWVWTALMVVLSSWVMLHVRGAWRRWVLAVSLVLVSVAWVPVLALCGRIPSLSAPLLGIVWALAGSLIYAARHREPR